MAGFRTVVISKNCKLESRLNFLVVRAEDEKRIFIREIENLIIESTAVAITTALIADLIEAGVNVVLCNNRHLPIGSVIAFHDNFESPKRIHEQINWKQETVNKCWQLIVKEKINQQASFVKELNNDYSFSLLLDIYGSVQEGDFSNKEALAARVYFSSVFGSGFRRDIPGTINTALNYGYNILMSFFARELSAMGYVTELGLWHRSATNAYNLASDLMEPFRPVVDRLVFNQIKNNPDTEFDSVFKRKLVELFELKINVEDETQYLGPAVRIYIRRIFRFLAGEVNSIYSISYSLPKNL